MRSVSTSPSAKKRPSVRGPPSTSSRSKPRFSSSVRILAAERSGIRTISAAVSSGRACGEEVRRGGESQRTAQRDLRGVGRPVCRKALPAERFVAHGERRVVAAHGLRPHEDRVGPRPQAHHLAPVGGRRENQSPGRPIVHIAVARQGDRSVHVHRRNSNRVISGFAPIRMGNPTYPMPSLT